MASIELQRTDSLRSDIDYCGSDARGDGKLKDDTELTVLHMACSRGNLSAVRELVAQYSAADCDSTDILGDTPLHKACRHGNPETVKILLDKGATINVGNNESVTPLHAACKEGHIDVVKELLKPGRGDVKLMFAARDHTGNTPIHCAVKAGVFEIVEVLLSLGADPNVKNTDGIHPTHVAAARGYADIAKVLLKYKNEVKDARDGARRTPLHHAAIHNQVSIITNLLQKGADIEAVDEDSATPLLLAAAWGRPNAVKVLLQGGAQANTVDKDGKSVVYWAAEEGHVDVLNILLQYEGGIQLCSVTELQHNNTPLHIAAYKGRTEAMKTILAKMEKHSSSIPSEGQDEVDGHTGVRFDVRNDKNQSPLHLAALKGHLDIVKSLVRENQCSIVTTDEDGNTPLHLAAKYGQVEVADYLIDAGAEVDARNGEQWTPMYCAADKGHVGVISLLIKADAPFNSINLDTIAHTPTPLFLACKRGHASAVELLLENGADVSVKDKPGFNCLDIAIENGHKEVAMRIISSDSWKSALRNAIKNETPMRRMIQKFPDVAHAVLDRCMTDNVTEDNPDIMSSKDYKVTFNFEFIEDWRTSTRLKRSLNRNNRNLTNTNIADYFSSPMHAYTTASTLSPRDKEKQSDTHSLEREEEQATKWKPEGFFKQHHPLNLMVKYNRGDLLRHPVVYALLDRKWRRYGRKGFIINLSLYLLFLFFLTLYALLLPRPDHIYCREYSVLGNVSSLPRVNESCPWDNLTFAQGDPTVPNSLVHRIFLYISAAIVLVLGVIRLVLELLQFAERCVRYFLNAENYLEVPTFIFAIAFVIQFGMNCWCPTSWQWQLGALSVFFAWMNLILFLKRFPLVGIYVLMYTTILFTFSQVMLIAFLFVIAFSLAFYMILYRAVLDSGILNTSPFRTPGLSIHKTMTMTTGEFEYDTIFGNSENNKDQLTEFTSLAYFLWILFLIAMPILLVNLLVGLAVDDAKSIQERAKSRKIEIKVNHALQVQELMRHLLSQGPDIGLKTLHPNRKLKGWEWFKDQVWGVERWDSVDSLQKYRKPNQSDVGQIKVQTEELASEIKQMKDKITSINQLLHKMAKKQGIDEATE